MTTVNRESVDAEVCLKDDRSWNCHLTSDDCTTTFMSSRELINELSIHGGSCTTSKRTQNTKIGQCGDDGPCASVKELCSVPALFVGRSNDCTVMKDLVDDEQTTYGSCRSGDLGNACLWSADECDDKESFKIDDDCTCDKVRVGGCRRKANQDIVFCAVSEQACDSHSEWISVADMRSIKDCYLCREPSSDPLLISTSSSISAIVLPSSSPIASALTSPVSVSSPAKISETQPVVKAATGSSNDNEVSFAALHHGGSGNKGNNGALVGGLVGGIAGAAILVALLSILFVNRRKKRKTAESNTNTTRDNTDEDAESLALPSNAYC